MKNQLTETRDALEEIRIFNIQKLTYMFKRCPNECSIRKWTPGALGKICSDQISHSKLEVEHPLMNLL